MTGLLDLQNDSALAATSSATITNSGTFQKSAGSGTLTVSATFDNTGGTINAESGTIALQGGQSGQGTTIAGGSITVSNGAIVNLSTTGTITLTGSVGGSGQ